MSGWTSSVSLGRVVRAHPLTIDLAVATVVGALILLDGSAHAGHDLWGHDERTGWFFVVVAYGSMLLRRRSPWVASIVVVAATAGYLTAGGRYWWIIAAPAVVLFHLASAGPQRRARLPAVAVACGVALVSVPALLTGSTWWAAGGHEASVAGFAACCIALAAGDAARNRRAYLAEVQQRAAAAERERERDVREHVAAERMRIARDLHDSLGHHIALINAQAGMAARVFDTQPDTARGALVHITSESRAALDDLRGTLGLLRQPDDVAPPTEPLASLTTVGDLVEGFRRSGLPVELTIHGAARPLPTGVDLAAYRIVQESLTNVTKHSAAAPTRVLIDYAADAVAVLVDNEPPDHAAPVTDGNGHGLIGMRERAAAAAGHLSAGPRPDGGYQVRATLPLTPAGRP